ncbi:MAG TPA: CDP-diacylglycerol--glycerol-3-phosphate 3-phosphatidyltransferase [Firmicutes bacterium]|nr:CDP-diacylglycerol--glycerol-3-phosphate 3-phosphatidyltransferase [Bacillota bacterium]
MNLANKLTLVRIILVPVFMFVLLVKILPYGEFIAAGIFILAAITDGLDGYIARKHNQVTKLGKLMDPLADKLLVTAALVSLVEMGLLKSWVAFIIIGREFLVTGIRAVAAAEGIVISASKLGKYKTVAQIIAIVATMIKNFPFEMINFPFQSIAMIVAVFFTIVSGVDYFMKASPLIKASMK